MLPVENQWEKSENVVVKTKRKTNKIKKCDRTIE